MVVARKMNLTALQRKLERLAVLLEIRADRSESEREERLRLRLLAVLALLLASEDYRAFEVDFLNALRSGMEELDPNGGYGYLIDREIASQRGYLHNFIQDMRNGKLSEAQMRNRAGMYSGSLGSFKERINLEQEGDNLLTWFWDETMEEDRHCSDCRGLDGQTKTARQWATLGLYPRSPNLLCWTNCRCRWS